MSNQVKSKEVQTFEVETQANILNSSVLYKLIKIETSYQKTSLILILLYSVLAIYDTIDFCYSFYLIYKSCRQLAYIYWFDIIRDIFTWLLITLLFKAVKNLSTKKFNKILFLLLFSVLMRFIYIVELMRLPIRQDDELWDYCRFTDNETRNRLIGFIVEAFVYLISMLCIQYLMKILENLRQQPSKYIYPDVLEKLLLQ